MRVHVVDPSAYTPPYDDALCRALARAGAQVELYTSHFTYGMLPEPVGYSRREHFYRLAHGRAPAGRGAASGPRSRPAAALKMAEHVPDMLRYRHLASGADVVHFQWLPVQHLDRFLLPRGRGRPALVITAHDVLPREPRPGQRAAQRRLYERFDAIVVHTERGRERLTGELGIEPSRVHVIPHGALGPASLSPSGVNGSTLPPGFAAAGPPVVLFFGLLRPYKGLDVLLDAWHDVHGAELWIVGMPRMDMASLHASATASVRFLERFVSGAELDALLRRASLVVLPYREIEASGVAFSAIGAGVPLLLSDVGGFPEIAASGSAWVVPAGDARALAQALQELVSDPAQLEMMAQSARAAARGSYAWEGIASSTLALYERLLRENRAR